MERTRRFVVAAVGAVTLSAAVGIPRHPSTAVPTLRNGQTPPGGDLALRFGARGSATGRLLLRSDRRGAGGAFDFCINPHPPPPTREQPQNTPHQKPPRT